MFNDFGGYGPTLINDVVARYIDAINSGFGLLKSDVTFVLNVLIILSIVWSALLWTFSDDHVIAEFARKLIFLGMFVWLVANWSMLVDKLGRTFMDLGLKAGGFTDADTYTSEPGNILYLCYNTIQPIIDQITRLCDSWSFYKNLGQILMLGMSVAAIVAAFFVITIQVALAVLTFKFGSLASFVLVPFGVLSKTAFIAERPLGWVVGSGIRLMVLTLVLGIANGIFTNLAPASGSTVTIYEALTIALAALLLMMFSLTATRLATDLVIGGPSLGAGAMVNRTAVAYQSAQRNVVRPTYVAVQAAATKGLSLGKTVVDSAASSFLREPGGKPRSLFASNVRNSTFGATAPIERSAQERVS